MQLSSFEEAMTLASRMSQTKHSVLLGNGFSIAFDATIVSYNALFTSADFGHSPTVEKAFKVIAAWNFERVIRNLTGAAGLADTYEQHGKQTAEELDHEAAIVKIALVDAIPRTHPDYVFQIHEHSYNSRAISLRSLRKSSR